MKRNWFAAALCLLILLSGCTGQTPQRPQQPSAPPEETAQSSLLPAADTPSPVPEETPDPSMDEGGKILIAYFSMVDVVPEGADAVTHATPATGNTRTAAQEIQAQMGGDLFQIETDSEYPVLHTECSAIAEDEMRSDARPTLTSQVDNMDDYDVVFVGYPIWWYTSPMVIRSFLEAYDFSGKTIVPFCTTMSAGIGQSVDEIKELCPNATVLDGLTLRTGRADSMHDSIADWLEGLDLL